MFRLLTTSKKILKTPPPTPSPEWLLITSPQKTPSISMTPITMSPMILLGSSNQTAYQTPLEKEAVSNLDPEELREKLENIIKEYPEKIEKRRFTAIAFSALAGFPYQHMNHFAIPEK